MEAGAYGVSQSRKRAFIWAASPEETLPEWPEPMHVFAVPELKVTLSHNLQYAAVRSTASGAPFRAITVRDTIGDLPAVVNGASKTNLEVTILKIISKIASFYKRLYVHIQFTMFCFHSIKVKLSHGFRRKFEETWLSLLIIYQRK